MNNSCQEPTLVVSQCNNMQLHREYLQEVSKPCVPQETKEEL